MEKQNLSNLISESAQKVGTSTAQAYKHGDKWVHVNYNEMEERINNCAAGLIKLGIVKGDMIGIFSDNRPEWSVADFASIKIGAVTVPIYSTNTSSQVSYIAKDCGMKAIFIGNAEQLEKLLEIRNDVKSLKYVIVFDNELLGKDSDFASFDEICEVGAQSILKLKDSDGSADKDLATLIYTSGTTGEPKGVMLSHSNFFHQFRSIDANFHVGPKDRSLCFLPLSHVYERTWSYYVFRCGAQNFYLPDPKRILEYLHEVRPTVMVSVPRLYEKIYSAIRERLDRASLLRRRLFHWALEVGEQYQTKFYGKRFISPWLRIQHKLADMLVLKKIRDIMGGPKNFFSSGGAPLSRVIEEFFFACGILICQGYGLTETSPMVTNNNPNHFRFGTIGRPVPECRVKLSSEGEIMIKGPNVMLGYYNKPEETSSAMEDGWLKTGDIGSIDQDGYIRITDRKKDIIITSGGKNIAPQRIETVIGKDHYIEQIAVVGNDRKYVSALIVPAFSSLEDYAASKKINYSDHEDLISKPEIYSFYEERIESLSSELARFERVKRFTLLSKPFSIEKGEITPTLKVKRRVIEERYRDEIDRMYEA